MITGQEPADNGVFSFAKDTSVGYLKQENDISSDDTIYEIMLGARPELVEMEQKLKNLEGSLEGGSNIDEYLALRDRFESEGGYQYKSMIASSLKGLGFTEDDFSRPFNTLSGGQKTRVHLAALLFKGPDLLILDEPTNHLDIAATEYLESFLKTYPGSVLLVSHDRYFLDTIVTKIIAIEEGSLISYSGNYSAYAEKSRQRYKARLMAWQKQQDVIKHEQAVITKLKSFNREKSIKRAESREKKLDNMELIEKPEEVNGSMTLRLSPLSESGNDVLDILSLSKAFSSSELFRDADISIKKGEHVAIIGDNGTGKTTLLKIIAGLENADSGSLKTGTGVVIGYYDQEHHELNENNTLFDEISDAYPDLDNTKIRNTLASFLFTGDDVYKKISSLSGGEKGRLSLAKLMLSKANFLILDEPTNHLDITSREILQDAILSYTGTILCVSHDRYFVDHIATRILHLNKKHFYSYNGNYEYYLSKRHDVEENPFIPAAGTDAPKEAPLQSETAANSRLAWQQQKAEQGKLKRQKAALEKLEETISKLEEEDAGYTQALSDPKNGNDLPFLADITAKQADLKVKLDELYAQWEELSEAIR
ncbi:MAG: ABC-F family ATP-binding cassette domain-containing protein, partial [Lachnospiraceae bacterium]|nr:ABC-F family ATP-binding cassette domain-containing protein [Lachnospiraceae bacterium]